MSSFSTYLEKSHVAVEFLGQFIANENVALHLHVSAKIILIFLATKMAWAAVPKACTAGIYVLGSIRSTHIVIGQKLSSVWRKFLIWLLRKK